MMVKTTLLPRNAIATVRHVMVLKRIAFPAIANLSLMETAINVKLALQSALHAHQRWFVPHANQNMCLSMVYAAFSNPHQM